MLIVAIGASLIAAALNAGSSILERLATSTPGLHKLFSTRETIKNSFSNLFLMGMGLQILAAIIQAVALSKAPLTLVEPLMTTDLLFLLIIIHYRLDAGIRAKEWLAAGAMIAGMTVLFLTAQPAGGHLRYAFTPWLYIIVTSSAVVVIALALVKLVTSPKQRAAFAAIAAAVSYALNAAFTKLALTQWQRHGIIYVLLSWPLYALAVSGAASIYLMQLAFGSGPLAVAQPIIEVIEPSVSVIIGISVFGDQIQHGTDALAIELLAVAVIVLGILILGSSEWVQLAGENEM